LYKTLPSQDILVFKSQVVTVKVLISFSATITFSAKKLAYEKYQIAPEINIQAITLGYIFDFLCCSMSFKIHINNYFLKL
jgi:hypothetical protein